ncbi:MAG: type IV toxin-antitoxin system AbiEi family antitoxin [Ottowia sp.]|uniref:type IV toxin-antitoxin system AbiEi family antitoxin domain-containing protein n=1 Tax=Ottowia sp. TaxID=1898956 RepID=UPI0039E3B1C4
MPQHLSDVLNACERMGKLNVRGEELRTKLPGASPEALRKALYRQQRAGRLVRLSRGSDHWLIVPLQHASTGSPPLETWLDPWLRKTLGTPYYVGLLSAAETYGASPYAVMVTQVMVENNRRPVTVGRHELVFHACSRIEAMPTRWHESADGRFKVSTPELTTLDLIQRESMLGGMVRVREVLRALWPHCTPQGLILALDAMQSVPVAQRLGALLTLDDQAGLRAPLSDWLRDRPTRLIALEGALPPGNERDGHTDTDFKVWVPPQQGANS